MADNENGVEISAVWSGLAFYLLIFFVIWWGWWSDSKLDVIAGVDSTNVGWSLTVEAWGDDGDSVDVAKIWAEDDLGRRYTASAGSETIAVPRRVGSNTVRQVTVHAIPKPDQDYKRGSSVIQLTQSRARYKDSKLLFFLIPIGLFVGTVIVAALPSQHPRGVYTFCLFGAVFLSITMVICISLGIGHVSQHGESFDVLRLDFGYVFKGSYVPDSDPAWIFSLMQPTEEAIARTDERLAAADTSQNESIGADSAPVVKGFGAPLWVILLSVIGASMFTLRIILDIIEEKIALRSKPDTHVLRRRIHSIVLHQFYVFFSPIASILVYQLLVMSEAADQPATVAFAVLGAGVATNSLLDRAKKSAQKKAEERAVGGEDTESEDETTEAASTTAAETPIQTGEPAEGEAAVSTADDAPPNGTDADEHAPGDDEAPTDKEAPADDSVDTEDGARVEEASEEDSGTAPAFIPDGSEEDQSASPNGPGTRKTEPAATHDADAADSSSSPPKEDA